jgi:hypothetical protein
MRTEDSGIAIREEIQTRIASGDVISWDALKFAHEAAMYAASHGDEETAHEASRLLVMISAYAMRDVT